MRILFAHGAGAHSSHPWMQAWAERLGGLAPTTTFDYPYAREGRRLPDRLPTLLDAHRAQLDRLRRETGGPVVLAGKSMGSRVGCHLAVERSDVAAIVCFGYPLVSAGKRRAVRDRVLLELRTPILFIQGTRDRLCPLDMLEPLRERMEATASLHVVQGGDHSLLCPKRQLAAAGRTQDDVDREILDAIGAFLRTARRWRGS